jgi:hypothetical protein
MRIPESLAPRVDPEFDDGSPDHVVCDCQVDAVPRLALCGWDCTDVPYGRTDNGVCPVCMDLMKDVFIHRSCQRCR